MIEVSKMRNQISFDLLNLENLPQLQLSFRYYFYVRNVVLYLVKNNCFLITNIKSNSSLFVSGKH